jgi:hypothetical protein
MKNIIRTLTAIVALFALNTAQAQFPTPDFEVLITDAEINAATSAGGPSEPNSLATEDGETIFFGDSQSDNDAVIRWQNGTITVYATESELVTAAGAGGSGASIDDLDTDSSGTLYGKFRHSGGGGNMDFVARIPSPNTVELLVNDVNGVGIASIEVDKANDRLIMAFSDNFDPGTAEDIAFVPLGATDATPTVLATEASLAAATGDSDIGLDDITVQSDGTVLVNNPFPAGSPGPGDGDIIAISPAGAVSLFAEAADLIAPTGFGGTPQLNTFSMDVLPDDRVVIYHSSSTGPGEFFAIGLADGSAWGLLSDEATYLADSDISAAGGTDLSEANNSFKIDSNGDGYWCTEFGGIIGVVKISGFFEGPSTSAQTWYYFE